MKNDKKIELLNSIKQSIDNLYSKERGEEFKKWEKRSENILIKIFGEESKELKDFIKINNTFYAFDRASSIRALNKGLNEANALIDVYIESVELFSEEIKDEVSEKDNVLKCKKIFIVHGRDESIKIEVARFLEQLNLEPIILSEQVNGGRTIIEKIEEYTDVKYGIVIYTPCDIGKLNKEGSNFMDRARQNVVFEHGFLMGKIGRSNVSVLAEDNIELPNDISGIIYTSHKNEWKINLARELNNNGYDIDFNKLYK